MTESSLKNFEPDSLHVYEPKSRLCLMCRKPFTSSWPGERVCSTCKTTGMWREGSTLRDEYE